MGHANLNLLDVAKNITQDEEEARKLSINIDRKETSINLINSYSSANNLYFKNCALYKS